MQAKDTRPEFTEQALVLSLRQGKPEALSMLYDKYASVLLGLIIRILRDQEIAETVLQNTFVAIWQQKASYNPSRLKLLSWLILIARDTAVAALKSGNYQQPAQQGADGEAAQNNARQLENKVAASFCDLKQNEKAVLDLIYLKGYSCAETAAALEMPAETVKIILKLACKHLRTGNTT